jgi:hypothetical protein
MLATASSAPALRATSAGIAWSGASRSRSQPSANAVRYRKGGKASSRGSGSNGGVIGLPYPSAHLWQATGRKPPVPCRGPPVLRSIQALHSSCGIFALFSC